MRRIMTDEPLTLERAVARFVVNFGSNDIDTEAREDVRKLIKDQLAIQVGASQLPWSKQVRAFRNPRPGSATIVGEGMRAAAADAAYLNATYGHGFEYDDFAGNAHPGCCVVPAAIALGEELGASLEQVIVAMVAGYETYVRIGYLGSPALLNEGWQPHSVLANFGAAAVAAKLHGLDEDQTLHALSIALSHAGGTTEYASTGGSIKRVHAGISVRNGIEACDLARAGVTGPRRFLVGDRGFYRMFPRTPVTDQAVDMFVPDAALQLRQLKFKPYCCCAATHAYIEAMAEVRPRVADIEAIDAKIQTMTDAIVGNRNAHIYQPRNIEELQYSLPAQMALSALGLGNGYKTHRAVLEGELQLTPDSDIIALAGRIKLHVDRDLDARYPRTFAADVTVRYRDGSSQHIFLDKVKGTPANPFTREEHQAKLDELTEEVIGRRQAGALFALLDRMAPDTPVRDLGSLLQRR
jgi:2-methylcitrate dehydratase PrpD